MSDFVKPSSAVRTLRQFGDVQITAHFSVSEFDCPARYGLELAPYPDEWIDARLRPLCEVLEVLRAELGGHPVRIISGYRTPAWNTAHIEAGHKAAVDSQHLHGLAADIEVEGVSPAQVQLCAGELAHQGRIRGLGCYHAFTHVDLRTGPQALWIG